MPLMDASSNLWTVNTDVISNHSEFQLLVIAWSSKSNLEKKNIELICYMPIS